MTEPNDVLTQQGGQANQYLTFMLGGEEYGVDILKVQEIRGWESATEIPNTPDYVLGVLNLRGIVVPIVDLRKRFALQSAEFGPATVVVIVKVNQAGTERTVGMVVDAISDVYNIASDEMQEAPDFGGVVSTEYIKALTNVEDKMVILLDVDLLINAGVMDMGNKEKNVETEMYDKE